MIESSRFSDVPFLKLDGASILVTGGTGSFGKAFIRSVIQRFNPARLIIFSRDELKQFEMQQDDAFRDGECLRYFIGDVRDCDRLEMAMRGVDYVVHAAALKQIPATEYNPFECIRTNVHGAENVVTAAIRAGVKRVLAISTDKAVNPINLYGASKLAADKIFVAANNLSGGDGPIFSVVRYGNVIGSRGSVVPYFQQLVRDGAESLPITDDRMTRFWISLPQVVDFVLTGMELMQGGEIFVPKIPSMRILDVAEAIAPGLPTRIVGIRPGEKLHEVMITEDDARTTLELPDRYVVEPAQVFWSRSPFLERAARPVSEEFRYASGTNDQWLGVEELREIIEDGQA